MIFRLDDVVSIVVYSKRHRAYRSKPEVIETSLFSSRYRIISFLYLNKEIYVLICPRGSIKIAERINGQFRLISTSDARQQFFQRYIGTDTRAVMVPSPVDKE